MDFTDFRRPLTKWTIKVKDNVYIINKIVKRNFESSSKFQFDFRDCSWKILLINIRVSKIGKMKNNPAFKLGLIKFLKLSQTIVKIEIAGIDNIENKIIIITDM